jgi:hypothetical protein
VVDHTRFIPVAVKSELPQLSVTVTIGAAGAEGSAKEPFNVFDVHPTYANDIE